MRDRGRRIVLEIVGRQHIVGRRDESLEETPGAARGPPQRLRIRVGHWDTRSGGGREADKARHSGRSEPKRGEGQRHWPGPVARCQGDNRCNRADDHRARHSAGKSHKIQARTDCRLRGRDPFEQMASADAEAPEGAADCVGHEPRLIRQERDGQCREGQRKTRIAAERPHMARLRDARAPRRNGGRDRNERRQHDRQDNEQRPNQRNVNRQGPSDE